MFSISRISASKYLLETREFWWRNQDTDLVLVSGVNSVGIHQAIILPLSPLLTDIVPSSCPCVQPAIILPPVPSDVLDAIVELLYLGNAKVGSEDVQDMVEEILNLLQINVNISCDHDGGQNEETVNDHEGENNAEATVNPHIDGANDSVANEIVPMAELLSSSTPSRHSDQRKTGRKRISTESKASMDESGKTGGNYKTADQAVRKRSHILYDPFMAFMQKQKFWVLLEHNPEINKMAKNFKLKNKGDKKRKQKDSFKISSEIAGGWKETEESEPLNLHQIEEVIIPVQEDDDGFCEDITPAKKPRTGPEWTAMNPHVLKVEPDQQNNPGEHLIINNNKKKIFMFYCSQCERGFTNSASLASHIESKHTTNGKKLRCTFPLCTHLATKANLTRHMRAKHTKEELFECDECCMSFCTHSALKEHNWKHRYATQCKKCNRFYRFDKCESCKKNK